jgi:predicted hydrocarbon binding protein
MQVGDLERNEVLVRKAFPFLLMRSDFFAKMFDSLIKSYGSAGDAMIFAIGKDLGVDMVKDLATGVTRFGETVSEREILEKALLKLSDMGWGAYSVFEFDNLRKTVQIRVGSSPIVEGCSAASGGGCQFLQGLVIGVISELFEKEMAMGSPRCLKNSDGSCTFYLNCVLKNYDNLL